MKTLTLVTSRVLSVVKAILILQPFCIIVQPEPPPTISSLGFASVARPATNSESFLNVTVRFSRDIDRISGAATSHYDFQGAFVESAWPSADGRSVDVLTTRS